MTERPSDLLILALRPGDTLIVHLPSKPDESYAEDVKAAIRRQLSFDVPIIVVGPGVTFEVARPVSEPNARADVAEARLEAVRNLQRIYERTAAVDPTGEFRNRAADLRAALSVAPQPQPATCEHGRTAAHTTDCYCMCEHDCPGPVDA
jgi:hypothetical protein